MRTFTVGMPGYGNLGDDLISALLVGHIRRRWPGAEVGILSGRLGNPFLSGGAPGVRFFEEPRRSQRATYGPRKAAIKGFLADADLIMVGGGGLFQDAFSPFTIHHWMKYAYLGGAVHVPVWAVGVGFGVLRTAFARWYLRQVLDRFAVIQLRDHGSAEVLKRLGLLERCGARLESSVDIVTGSDLIESPFQSTVPKDPELLGCSIRPWPGLQFDQVVDLIQSVCRERGLRPVFFVLEYAHPETSEYDYACRLATALEGHGIEAQIHCYLKDDLDTFVQAFCAASHAIASRYHANILWQKLGTPVIPIAYYPKVARLYEERDGFALPVDDLDQRPPGDLFQHLSLTDQYDLPRVAVESGRRGRPVLQRRIVSGVNALETVHAGMLHLGRMIRQ